MLLLIGATATAFASGLAVQVLAIRWLDPAAYARFVFAIGLGNAAGMIGSIVTPVVALRAAAGIARPLPGSPATTLLASGVMFGMLALVLGAAIGWGLAAIALGQVPLVLVVAVGAGGLQAETRFQAMAVAAMAWAGSRLLLVGVLGWFIARADWLFALALVLALLVYAGLLALAGAFRRVEVGRATDSRALLRQYVLWLLFGWVLNADAILGPIVLSGQAAGDFALALTLGRQAVYLAAPIAFVTMPLVNAAPAAGQRARLNALVAVAALIAAGSAIVLVPVPNLVANLVRPGQPVEDAALARAFAGVGGLGALVTLLFAFAAGAGALPRTRTLALLAVATGAAMAVLGTSPMRLIVLQAGALSFLAATLWLGARRATARPELAPEERASEVGRR